VSKATINHVAQRAGVSIKTVSRVVNNEPNVSPATREKVLKAVEELAYQPNPSARSLAGKRTFVLGLLYDNPSANYVIDVQNGALAASRAQGYDLLIHPCDHRSPTLIQEVTGLLDQSRVDGLILTPPLSDLSAVLERLIASKLPFVRIAPAVDKHLSPYVATNDRDAAYQMTLQLLTLGHQRIGFICGHPDHQAVAGRYQGYCAALGDHGIEVQEKYVVQGYNSFESGEQAARKLLALTPRPTAIFAANDDMAAGTMMVAHQLGLNIPNDISVAGFDDTPVAHQIWPSLTTVRQPIQTMAQTAAELLLTQVQGKKLPSADTELESSLILRDSTGPVLG